MYMHIKVDIPISRTILSLKEAVALSCKTIHCMTYMSLVSLVYSFSRLVAAAGKGCLTAKLLT